MIPQLFKFSSKEGRLPILIYHQALPDDDPMRTFEITASDFEAQMIWLKKYMSPVPLHQGLLDLRSGKLKPGSVAVTFDDGYRNNCTVALPILSKLGLHATFFIASEFLDGGIMWNDSIIEAFRVFPNTEIDLTAVGLKRYQIDSLEKRRESAYHALSVLKYLEFDKRSATVAEICKGVELPVDLMMTSSEVRAMSDAGMAIGGHTLNHPILAGLSNTEAEEQIRKNKDVLEDITKKRCCCFAYPNGKPAKDYTSNTIEVVKSVGYDFAVSTSAGVGSPTTDAYQYPRYTPWRRKKYPFLLQVLQNYYQQASYV